MIKYKIINGYDNTQIAEFSNLESAKKYLSKYQKIGKIGLLKGKEVLKIKITDTNKQRMYNSASRNKKKMKKEWFGI